MTEAAQTNRLRIVLTWLAAIAFTFGATALTLLLLNGSVYSASAFVERYFSAVAGDHVAEALHTPGVALSPTQLRELGYPADTSQALLQPGMLTAGPENVTVVADQANPSGTHTVALSFTIGGIPARASYEVAARPALFGVVNQWEFVTSPLQLLTVTVQNGTHFTVGGVTLDARANGSDDPTAFTQTANYLAFAPANYQLNYDSELIAATPTLVTVMPDHENTATVDVQPTAALTEKVQRQLDDFLAQCVTQQVLQPAGCPFGESIDDRVVNAPTWSIVTNPKVTLSAGDDGFVMPPTPGVVHLNVEVQSLYDGSTSTLSKDVEYDVALVVQIRDDGSLAIQLH